MKRFLFIIGVFLPYYLLSEPVDSTEAKLVALNYYFHLNPNKSYVSVKKTITKQYKGVNTRYTVVFNNYDFVIVSADNATVPIFAYSNENSYRENNIPPSLEFWMQTEYDELVYYVRINNIGNENTIEKWNDIKEKNFDMSKATQSVSPLITTHWGQSFPNDGAFECAYNFFVESSSCGCGHCAAGCVAVAMAQIMNFWQSPSSDFDWCNMPNELITTSANYSTERNAIATLISDCGVKAEMDYCREIDGIITCNSGSTIGKAKQAIQNDYSYSNDMLHRYRWLTIKWKTKMRKSLNDGDPILYGGQEPNGGGHAFVCDGYEDDNYFHFNWGSNGSYDGYFYIDDDDGSPVIDYKKWQEAVFYIHPDQPSNVYCVDCSEIISISNIVSSVNPYNPNFPMITWNGISPLYNYIPFLNPNKPFASDIIYENGEIRLGYFDITAGTINVDNVIIPDKTNVHLKAYDEIIITNFETEEGAEFTAEIIPCPIIDSGIYTNYKLNSKSLELFTDINNDDDNINIYPNPANNTLYIEGAFDNSNNNLQIYNLLGSLIISKQITQNTTTIDISQLSNGVYFVKILTDNFTYKQKIIKQ